MNKKTTALILAGLVLLACLGGCKGVPSVPVNVGQSGSAEGRYVEEDISPEGLGREIMKLYVEGELIEVVSYDSGNREDGWRTVYRHHRSEDGGESWQQLDATWLSQYHWDDSAYNEADDSFSGGMSIVQNVEIVPRVGLLAIVGEHDYESLSTETYALLGSGGEEPQPLSLKPMAEIESMPDMEIGIATLLPLPNNKILARIFGFPVYTGEDFDWPDNLPEYNGIYDLTTGELVQELEDEFYSYMYSDGLLVLFNADNVPTVLHADTCAVADFTLPADFAFAGRMALPDSKGKVHCIKGDGLYTMDGDGEEVQVMRANIYSFGSPIKYLTDMALMDEDRYVMAFSDGKKSELKRYTFDLNSTTRVEAELTVFSIYESATLRQAISAFCIARPEINIIYESHSGSSQSFYEEQPVLDKNDILRNLTLRIMSGSGPDILVLDDLPLQSYAAQGALADLSELLAGVDVFENLVEPLKQDGKLYALPSRFGLPLLFTAADEADKYDSLDSLLAAISASPARVKVPDFENFTNEDWDAYSKAQHQSLSMAERPVVVFGGPGEMLDALLDSSLPALYADGGIDRQALTTLLEAAKQISDYRQLANPIIHEQDTPMSLWGGSYQSVNEFMDQRALTGYVHFDSVNVLRHLSTWMRLRDGEEGISAQETTAVPMPGLAEGSYQPQVLVGVNATGKNLALAKEFVATLLSDDVQSYDLEDGLPVVRGALQIQLDVMAASIAAAYGTATEIVQPNLEALISRLATPVLPNELLRDAILRHSLPYFRSEATLEQAVEAVIDETALYFTEQG